MLFFFSFFFFHFETGPWVARVAPNSLYSQGKPRPSNLTAFASRGLELQVCNNRSSWWSAGDGAQDFV